MMDHVFITLKKTCFYREIDVRMIGVKGFLALLSNDMKLLHNNRGGAAARSVGGVERKSGSACKRLRTYVLRRRNEK